MITATKPTGHPAWCRSAECAEGIHLSATRIVPSGLIEGMPTGELGVDVCLVGTESTVGLYADGEPVDNYSPTQIRQLIAALLDALDAVEFHTPFGGAR